MRGCRDEEVRGCGDDGVRGYGGEEVQGVRGSCGARKREGYWAVTLTTWSNSLGRSNTTPCDGQKGK